MRRIKISIPDTIKNQVNEIVKRFNEEFFKNRNQFYIARYKGTYLYLDRSDFGKVGPICRLKYNGAMDEWDFAIFKYSSEQYDSDEWFFPGSDLVDGTVEGAMKAGLKAYP